MATPKMNLAPGSKKRHALFCCLEQDLGDFTYFFAPERKIRLPFFCCLEQGKVSLIERPTIEKIEKLCVSSDSSGAVGF